MKIGQAIKMAFKALGSNKLRSFLTMLGVIIGVTCVALLTTVASGAKETIVGTLKKESQLVSLMMMPFSGEVLTRSRLDQVANTISEDAGEFDYSLITYNTAAIQTENGPKIIEPSGIFKNSMTLNTSVIATTSNFSSVRNFDLTGRFFNESETNVCVVDANFVKAFFGNVKKSSVIGKKIQLGGADVQTQIEVVLPDDVTSSEIEKIYFVLTETLKQLGFSENSFPSIDLDDSTHSWFNNWSGYYIHEVEDQQVMEFFLDTNLVLLNDEILTYLLNSLSTAPSISSLSDHFLAENVVNIITTEMAEGKEFTIVGVIKGESSFFSSQINSSFIEPEYKGIFDRMDTGEVFVLFDQENISLISAPIYSTAAPGDFSNGTLSEVSVSYPTLSNASLYGAYFKFADESKVEIGSSSLMTSMFKNGFSISAFLVVSMNTVANYIGNIMDILTIMLGVIAGISLVVGGIGIMNIMLVSVSERTREIGIRKAIGAKKSYILTQFLIEALVVTLVGGAIGIFISFIGTLIIGSLMGITLIMPFWVIALSIGFCLGIGVIFGMYPAIKAAKMKPIEALRRD